MNTLNDTLRRVTACALAESQSTQDFLSWVPAEHAKVNDPKARSYSLVASLIAAPQGAQA